MMTFIVLDLIFGLIIKWIITIGSSTLNHPCEVYNRVSTLLKQSYLMLTSDSIIFKNYLDSYFHFNTGISKTQTLKREH